MSTLQFQILCPDHLKEPVMAFLEPLGFEGFWDNGDTILAYVPQDIFNHKSFYDTLSKFDLENNYSYHVLEEKNWNEEWEKNFDPIVINDQVYIYASFHPQLDYPYQIKINPKMSFGTGHHATTRLSAILLLHLDVSKKTVLDMGCGTGVLAILANQMGAQYVQAIDNDQWSYENAMDNVAENKCKDVIVSLGSIEAIENRTFDIVISNITKNINLGLLPSLAQKVSPNGYLILSGFLDFDLNEMQTAAEHLGFKEVKTIAENTWQGLCMQKR